MKKEKEVDKAPLAPKADKITLFSTDYNVDNTKEAVELHILKLQAQELESTISAREKWAPRIWWLVMIWLLMMLVMLILVGFTVAQFELQTPVLVTLIGSTTLGVIGVLNFVV